MSETVKYLKATNKDIPKDWCWVRLGELCEFIRGVTFDKAEVSAFPEDGRVAILRAGNIGLRLDTTNDLIWVPNGRVSSEQLLQVGDAAICMSSGSAEVVGKTAPVEVEWKGSVGAFCGIVRAKDPSTADFVNFWFRSRLFLDWRDDQARGANIQNLRFSQLTKLEIPLPPPPEQRRIAGVLREQMAAVEKARAAAQARLEAVKALPAAFLREVFPQPGQSLLVDWCWVKLGEVCEFIGGSQPDKGNFKYEPSSEYVRLVQIQDFRLSDVAVFIPEKMALRTFDVTDVMIGRYGPPVFQILRGLSGAYNVALMKTAPSGRLDKDFLYFLLQWPEIQRDVIAQSQRSAGQSGVQKEYLEKYLIPLPPIYQQRQLATQLNEQMTAVSKARIAAEEELNTINALPAALLRRAFNGEI